MIGYIPYLFRKNALFIPYRADFRKFFLLTIRSWCLSALSFTKPSSRNFAPRIFLKDFLPFYLALGGGKIALTSLAFPGYSVEILRSREVFSKCVK